MNILRNLVIAYLLIGLIVTCVVQLLIFLKFSKDKSLSYGITIKDYIVCYFTGIIKQLHTIVVWPTTILGYFWFIKNTDVDTFNELYKKFLNEED